MPRFLSVVAATVGLFVAGEAAAGCIDGYDRRVWIENETSVTMTQFHASIIDTGDWEEDILGADVLRPGQRVRVNIDDCSGYCLYDLRAVFADGEEVTRWGYNVCEADRWTVVD